MDLLKNKMVQMLLIGIIVVAICLIAGVNVNLHAGSSGIGFEAERITK
jgi:hypothetical protein